MKRKLSDFEVKELVDQVELFSKRGFADRAELEYVIELFKQSKKDKDFDKLIFEAKYCVGLLKGIENSAVTNVDNLKREFLQSIYTVQSIINSNSGDKVNEVAEKYIVASKCGFNTISNLIRDLELVKIFFNELKRKNDSKETTNN